MSSSTLRIIAILLAVGALVLGYMGYKAGQTPAQTVSSQTEDVVTQPVRYPVVIAARDITADHVIEADDVTTVFVDSQPADSYDSLGAVSGEKTRLPIAAGDLILEDHFHKLSSIVSAIGPGERAIAVRVDEVTGAGGFIEPGDRVDVLFFLPSSREVGDDSSAQRILKGVRVLAYGNTVDTVDRQAIAQKAKLNKSADARETGQAEDAADEEEPSGKKSKTAVLSVADKDLSSLLLAESTGRLRLALIGGETSDFSQQASVNPGDDKDSTERQLVTLEQYKPAGLKPAPKVQTKRVVRSAPRQTKVTVHRGSEEATVSVNREK